MKPGYKRVPEEEQKEFNDKAIKLAQQVTQAMVLCTCAAYERLQDFSEILEQLENITTPLGKTFVKRAMPIITRQEDTIDTFTKDMMLTARDVVQEHFTKGNIEE